MFNRTQSYNTTIAGILTILASLIPVLLKLLKGEMPAIEDLSIAATGIVGGIGLIKARDNDKTDEEVGANLWARERADALAAQQRQTKKDKLQ